MKGSSLCGCVVFETNEKVSELSACHCGMCEKWSSSPFIAVQLKDEFITKGKEYIEYYSSSEWAERTFCRKCGTLLFYRSKNPIFYHFNAALFNLKEIKSIAIEIFTDKKPNYYNLLSESSKKMTENDVFEYLKSLNEKYTD